MSENKNNDTHPADRPEVRVGSSSDQVAINVLVVDDEPSLQQLLRSTIEQSHGFQVDTAANAADAFKLYKKNLYPVIVLDIRLGGGMDGITLLKKIKRNDPAVNIIMITGYGSIDIAVECMKEGAWDFIPKPFSYDHFQIVVGRAAENFQLKHAAHERDYYMELSRLDSLTEVYNQRLFHIILNSEVARARRYKKKFTLLFLDMNKFKHINDTYGHQKGDELLKQLALTMKHNSRESDFLFRYGGDEFAILLPETEKEGALIFAKRLKEEVEKLQIEGTTIKGVKEIFPVTVSIGIAMFPLSADNADDLIHQADKAMFEAKQKTRNQVAFL